MPFHHEPMGPLGIAFAIFGGLAWLAILAGIVLLVIWALRTVPGRPSVRSTPAAIESPLDTLARRFAMGEISADEFERARDLIRGGSVKPPPA